MELRLLHICAYHYLHPLGDRQTGWIVQQFRDSTCCNQKRSLSIKRFPIRCTNREPFSINNGILRSSISVGVICPNGHEQSFSHFLTGLPQQGITQITLSNLRALAQHSKQALIYQAPMIAGGRKLLQPVV